MKNKVVKTREGVVLSNKMTKTVIVEVQEVFRHPLYEKVMRKSNTFKAHDEAGTCKPGDKVTIVETRPISKDKRWRVVQRGEK
ncbi:MAG: 30S ribosomal protein S17 [Candidatus Margulisiibacteriota bacterium]